MNIRVFTIVDSTIYGIGKKILRLATLVTAYLFTT